MNIIHFLKQMIEVLEQERLQYAVAGGLVASVYRKEERTTRDLDFLIISESSSQQKAEELIKAQALNPHIIRKADLEGGPLFAIKRKNTEPYMVVGKDSSKPGAIGLDFILPSMPWFKEALERSSLNLIDFGWNKKIPCITVEDIIISKFYSYKNDPRRYKDLDDLQSIFEAKHVLDCIYIQNQMRKMSLIAPKALKGIAPKELFLTIRK
ncbi:nucleotidyl transferase AbiEii/AbiGii toxin family protein [bacterium]|nr:nucleotidyl transferase AbiEii/AbiGii toxin family protein [bacterium]